MSPQLTLIADIGDVLRSSKPGDQSWEVRPFSEDMVPELSTLYRICYAEQHAPDEQASRAEMDITIRGEYGPVWPEASPQIFIDGRLAGCSLVVREPPWDDVPRQPFVIELMTDPAHQGCGIATALFHEAARVCAAAGKKTLALRVLSENDGAERLYRKLGFVDM